MSLYGIKVQETPSIKKSYLLCQVRKDKCVFIGVSAGNSIRAAVAISETPDFSSYILTNDFTKNINEVFTFEITTLSIGKLYYYRPVIYTDGSWVLISDSEAMYFTNGATANQPIRIAFPADLHLNGYKKPSDLVNDSEQCWYSRCQTDSGETRRTKIISKEACVHTFTGFDPYTGFSNRDTNIYLDFTPTNCAGYSIKTNNPDLSIWLGDNVLVKYQGISPVLTTSEVDTIFKNLLFASYYLNGSQVFIEGNHEEDNPVSGTTTVGDVYPAQNKYLPFPTNGSLSRYGYVDYGYVRVIYLSPFFYDMGVRWSDDEDSQYFSFVYIRGNYGKRCTLGPEQTTFLHDALTTGNQKINLVCIHNMLSSAANSNNDGGDPPVNDIFSIFGLPVVEGVDYSYLWNNWEEMFKSMNECGKETILMLGHGHCYVRQRTKSGIWVFQGPAAYNGREDNYVVTQTNGLQNGGYGWRDSKEHCGADYSKNPISAYKGTLMMDIDPNNNTITTFCVDNEGNEITQIPKATFKYKQSSGVKIN